VSNLSDKVAVVTGASKGIGAGIAKALGAAGAAVAVNYATSKEGADRVVAQIAGKGGRAIAVQGDVSKAADMKRLFADTSQAFGPLDILVNNAGVFEAGPIESITEEKFHYFFGTNVLGMVLATQEALKHFRPAGGSIINIGTAGTANPPANTLLYVACKGAVNMITSVLARELGPRKIRVNSINPGGTETEGNHRLGTMTSGMVQIIVDRTPLGRFGQPEDIAPAAVFLASDDAAWITGEILTVSGGFK